MAKVKSKDKRKEVPKEEERWRAEGDAMILR